MGKCGPKLIVRVSKQVSDEESKVAQDSKESSYHIAEESDGKNVLNKATDDFLLMQKP